MNKYRDNPLAQRLLAVGVRHDQVDALLAGHPAQDIADQLDWLPLREAKSPARFLVAAIENRYAPPARIRLERVVAAEEAQGEAKQGASTLPAGDGADVSLPYGDGEDGEELHD